MKMTRNSKLDKILNGLLYTDYLYLEGKDINRKTTLEFLNKALRLESTMGELSSLKKELLFDSYIKEEKLEIHITEKGKKFLKDGGYTKKDEQKQKEQRIQDLTIKKFEWDKLSIIISFLALSIALITLLKQYNYL